MVVGKECKDALRRTQRLLRDEFSARALSLHQSTTAALAQAERARGSTPSEAAERQRQASQEIGELGRLRTPRRERMGHDPHRDGLGRVDRTTCWACWRRPPIPPPTTRPRRPSTNRRAASSDPLRVAIAGKVKAGKSTLLNALVGDQLAPTDARECTRVVTWYRDAHTYRVVAHGQDGSSRQARSAGATTSWRSTSAPRRRGPGPAGGVVAVGQPVRGHADRHPRDRLDLDRPVGPHLYVPHLRRRRADRRRRGALPGAPPAQHRRPLPRGLPRRRAGQRHAGQRRGRAVEGRRDRLLPARRHGVGPARGGPLRARPPHPPAVPVGHPGGRAAGPGGGHAAGGGVPPAGRAGGHRARPTRSSWR